MFRSISLMKLGFLGFACLVGFLSYYVFYSLSNQLQECKEAFSISANVEKMAMEHYTVANANAAYQSGRVSELTRLLYLKDQGKELDLVEQKKHLSQILQDLSEHGVCTITNVEGRK